MLNKQQRVAVAVDVLQRLKLGQYQMAQAIYVNVYEMDIPESKQLDVQKFFKGKTCEVCARGALVLSKAALFNGLVFDPKVGSNSEDELEDRLYEFLAKESLKVFGPKQGELIETAFEGKNLIRNRTGIGGTSKITTEENLALAFHLKHRPDKENLLREIMINVIEHGGVFKP